MTPKFKLLLSTMEAALQNWFVSRAYSPHPETSVEIRAEQLCEIKTTYSEGQRTYPFNMGYKMR